jgi:hypothetical protein
MDTDRIRIVLEDLLDQRRTELGPIANDSSKFARAGKLLLTLVEGSFRSFLTTELYSEIC